MEMMLRIASPELPEYSSNMDKYSTVAKVRERLFENKQASIIATNPPMASGFLANQVLFHLLSNSALGRNFNMCPQMPGYVMFDAGSLVCEKINNKWW